MVDDASTAGGSGWLALSAPAVKVIHS